MKKIAIVLMSLVMGLSCLSAKEMTWTTQTVWCNTNPEVVKTMPGAQEFAKANGLKLDFESVDTLRTDVNVPNFCFDVKSWADRVVAEHPEIGQVYYYNDELNLFFLVNYYEGKYANMFVASLKY